MRAWLSLGSNIDREHNIRSAVRELENIYGGLVRSSVYESAAVGTEGAHFLNMVVGIETDVSLTELSSRLRAIEEGHGRERGEDRFAPRTLDIDLLTYGDRIVRNGESVLLPRDEITRYAFVLRPLAEVAGAERHPLNGKSYRELWEEFDQGLQPLWPVSIEF